MDLLNLYLPFSLVTATICILIYLYDFDCKFYFSKKDNCYLSIIISFIPVLSLGLYLFILQYIFSKGVKIKYKKSSDEKYEDVKNDIKKYLSDNIFDYKINSFLNNISKSFETILANDYFKETAYKQIEFIIIYINECDKNNLLKDKEVIKEIDEMLYSLNEFLNKFVEEIRDTDSKVKTKLKEYLSDTKSDFINRINSMKKDFEKE